MFATLLAAMQLADWEHQKTEQSQTHRDSSQCAKRYASYCALMEHIGNRTVAFTPKLSPGWKRQASHKNKYKVMYDGIEYRVSRARAPPDWSRPTYYYVFESSTGTQYARIDF